MGSCPILAEGAGFFSKLLMQAAATADEVAQPAGTFGYEISGNELLRLSGQKVGHVTLTKQKIQGKHN